MIFSKSLMSFCCYYSVLVSFHFHVFLLSCLYHMKSLRPLIFIFSGVACLLSSFSLLAETCIFCSYSRSLNLDLSEVLFGCVSKVIKLHSTESC